MWLLFVLALAAGPQDPPGSATEDRGPPPPSPSMSISEYARLVRERNGPRPDGPVPDRAFASPLWWEQDQCGPGPTDECLRRARNRLAMARAERMEAGEPRPSPQQTRPTPPPRCRTVTRPAESGVGGSVSRICGDNAGETERVLDGLLRDPAPSPCDRPAEGESQAVWIERCRALP